MGYTKLFSSILASSVWQEDLPTKIVWITMLALKNERHEVEASLPGLARLAGVDLKECAAAIQKFDSPDKYSRNPENDGRKVQRTVSGWRILNGEYYSHLLSADERREYQRQYQREYRKRRKTLYLEAAKDGAKAAIAEGMAERQQAATPPAKPVHLVTIEEALRHRPAPLPTPASPAPRSQKPG